jgi:integrase
MAKEAVTQLVLAEQGRAALTRSRAEAFDVARERVRRPLAKNTNRTYDSARGQWCAYCDALGIPWAPVNATELVLYLEQLGQRRAPNTVRVHLAAIADLDKACRVCPADTKPTSIREHAVVARWYQSWARDHAEGPTRRAAALTGFGLEALLRAAAEPQKNGARAAHVPRYLRDRCLILFGASGAFRGAELGALQLAHVSSNERGIQVYVARSKTDQTGQGADVALMPQGKLALCPVAAFSAWRVARGDAPGPLFPAIDRAGGLVLGRGLSERQITRLVREYAQRAGLELQISAHSLRATLATLASQNGHGLERIMKHGRWKSAHVAAGYVRQGELFRDNVTGGLFD